MKLIAAVDNNWGLGKNNDLLFRLPLDLKRFKETTLNQTVVMGKNTLISLPNSMPLKNRTNIVLGDYTLAQAEEKGFIPADSLDSLFKILKNITTEVYVIGGAMVYNTLLPYCSHALITKIEANGEADVFLKNLDSDDNFAITHQSAVIIDNGLSTKYLTYLNKNSKSFNL